MLEVLVAFTLLGSVISLGTPLIVRHGRLLAEHRAYQRALEELSNQMERLSGLPMQDLAEAVEQLEPSEFAAQGLPGATLVGQLAPSESGQRLTLQLSWDGRRSRPVTLAAWFYPEPPDIREPGSAL